MKISNLFENVTRPKTVAVFPGRFQPFHRGHAAIFEYLQFQYGDDAWIATSDVVGKTSPFTFAEKLIMMSATGLDPDRAIEVAKPYSPREITNNYDKDCDHLVMAVSSKDRDRFDFAKGGYFQQWQEDLDLKPMNTHAYIMLVPTLTFKIAGHKLRSATAIRNFYAIANNDQRVAIIEDLYGKYNSKVKALFDRKLT